jgi:DNA-binding XRE family transcriptional regulator
MESPLAGLVRAQHQHVHPVSPSWKRLKRIACSDIWKCDIALEAALPIYAAMPKTIYRPEYAVLVELVREMRLEAGLTQTDVSTQLGVTQSHLSDVERGTRRLDLIELRDLAGVCGVSLADIVLELETRLKKKRFSTKR